MPPPRIYLTAVFLLVDKPRSKAPGISDKTTKGLYNAIVHVLGVDLCGASVHKLYSAVQLSRVQVGHQHRQHSPRSQLEIIVKTVS